MLLLLFNTFGQMRQIPHGGFDLVSCTLQLGIANQRRGARQTSAGPVGDGDNHRQIPQQFFSHRRRLRFDLLLCF
jgi:hypothetical protein